MIKKNKKIFFGLKFSDWLNICYIYDDCIVRYKILGKSLNNSKCHRLTVVQLRKILQTLRKILRFVCANWNIHDFFIFPKKIAVFYPLYAQCLVFFCPFSSAKFSPLKLWLRKKIYIYNVLKVAAKLINISNNK